MSIQGQNPDIGLGGSDGSDFMGGAGGGGAMTPVGGGGSVTPPNPPYPVRVDVDYPPRLSRLLLFVKWLLVLPHYIALMVLGLVAYFVLIASWFAVVFTGRYPRWAFDFLVGVHRWGVRVIAYSYFQTDSYPPFSLADDRAYPARLEVDYPERIARWRPLVAGLLAIPVYIGASVLGLLAYFAVFFAWFAILFTGRFPVGLFNMVTIWQRWNARSFVYGFWMTEPYPPFVFA